MEDCHVSTYICRSQREMEATSEAYWVILNGLGKNILARLGDVELGISVRIFIKTQEGQVAGGIVADIFGHGVYITLLWVDESLRNRGLGSRLVGLAEEEARKLGCTLAHLDTYGFEAKPFYEKLGYHVFGVLEDYAGGYGKYFLKKSLA